MVSLVRKMPIFWIGARGTSVPKQMAACFDKTLYTDKRVAQQAARVIRGKTYRCPLGQNGWHITRIQGHGHADRRIGY